MPSIYMVGDNDRLTRCSNCNQQLLYDINEVEKEESFTDRENKEISVIYCPHCRFRIVLELSI